MKTQPFQVHLQGVLDVLANHLYSSEQVFIREVLQNACDAIAAKKLRDTAFEGEISIELITDGEIPQLIIEDNGIGLTEDEVGEFLSSIGASAKRGYLSNQRDNFIGQFGIGLLSCFMVSENITLITKSENAKPLKWVGKIDGTYEVSELDFNFEVGTKVYLSAKPSAKKFFEADTIRGLIRKYGEILPYPIKFSVNGSSAEQLNMITPVWEKTFSDRASRRNAILDYGNEAFNQSFYDFIEIDIEAFDTKGIVYILSQPINPNFKNSHKVFLKKMLLSDSTENILPAWAFFVKGVLNVSKLRPTASRESFYEDEKLTKLRNEIGKSVKKYFLNLAESNPEKLEKILLIHQVAFKSYALEDDDLFEIVIQYLKFSTNRGDLSISEIKDSVIRFIPDVDEFRKIAPVASARDMTIINSGYVYDTQLLLKLKQKKYKKNIEVVDVNNFIEIFEEISGDEKEQASEFLEICKNVLEPYKCRAEIKRFSPVTVPALYYMSQNVNQERQIKGAMDISGDVWGGILGGFLGSYSSFNYSVLCLNIDNQIVKRLLTLKNEELLSSIILILYVNALMMGHHPLDMKEMNILNSKILNLIDWAIQ